MNRSLLCTTSSGLQSKHEWMFFLRWKTIERISCPLFRYMVIFRITRYGVKFEMDVGMMYLYCKQCYHTWQGEAFLLWDWYNPGQKRIPTTIMNRSWFDRFSQICVKISSILLEVAQILYTWYIQLQECYFSLFFFLAQKVVCIPWKCPVLV